MENGTIIKQYKIISSIGKGGMGEVYLAEDTKLERQVALKVLLAEIADDEERVRRFVREAKAASALNHPNILTVHEIGSYENSRYIATELIKGKTLRQRLGGEALTLRETLDVAMQVAAALNAAHDAGIVHRDIKPENIMLRDDGFVKVLDFGLAKLTEKKQETPDSEGETRAQVNTSPGMVMGTAAYMSPEQARGRDVDVRSDIWSLGAVVYEMLKGDSPFAGETPNDSIAAILAKEPAPLGENTPAELQRIIKKSLQKNADERYQTVKDFLLDIKNLKKELEFSEELERSQIPNLTHASNVSTNQISENHTAIHSATVSTQNSIPQQVSSAEYIAGEVKKHKLGFLLAGLLLLAVIGFSSWVFMNRGTGSKQIESIAVMPFVNKSGNQDVEYLSDGMTETLINSLSQLPNLNVKARSSVFRYKGKEFDPKKIAAELNVQAILTGQVTQRGDQMTLNLELIDAKTENVLWGNKYERNASDLVTLQSEIARDVSSKLKSKLSGAEEAKVTKTYTANPEAYQLYLKGKFYWNKRTGEALKQSVVYFKQAIEKDPNYALAYAGLAQSYGLFTNYSVASPKDSMPQAKEAAMKALEIDDSVAEAHAALAIYLCNFAWNPEASEKELRRAIELNPNYATAYHWLGNVTLLAMGRFDEAVAAGRRAEELDPLSPIISADTGNNLLQARRYDEAIAQLKHALTIDPNFYYTHYCLGMTYHSKGMYAEAMAEYKKAIELDDDPYVKALLARTLAKTGERGEAVKLLNELKSLSATRYVPTVSFVIMYAALGDKDEAFSWLEKDFSERSYNPPYYLVDTTLDDLRDDPRFAEFVRRAVAAKMN